jgi:hypothetical protein
MNPGPSSGFLTGRILLAVAAVLAVVAVAITSVTIVHKKRVESERREAERIERVEREKKEAEETARVERQARQELEARAQEQARIATQERAYHETVVRAEQEREVARAEQARREREQRAAEETRLKRERDLAEEERLATEARLAAAEEAERQREEEEGRRVAELQAKLQAEEQARREAEVEKKKKEAAAAVTEDDDDETPEIETESTLDDASEQLGVRADGDVRAIYDYLDLESRDGIREAEDTAGIRWRLGFDWRFKRGMRLGTRLAGLCFINECDFEFVMERAAPTRNGLARGQFTFDELYLHFFRRERFDIVIGRMQTRFTLRSGVYAKSLDRNDSHNVRVTWTDGMHATYRARKGWVNNFIFQVNDPEGASSIRRGPLDFDDPGARVTYFYGLENRRRWGPVAQRGVDLSYLPSTLLKDDDLDGRREDYVGWVGRMVFRWPQRTEGVRVRGGFEIGYAPETPTNRAMDLPGPGDADGLAWDVVVSVMDFAPDHHIGVQYARTGGGWLLAPQFRPNEELSEIRYIWESDRFPLFEVRVRRREDLIQEVDTDRKRLVYDAFIRLTWRFKIKEH